MSNQQADMRQHEQEMRKAAEPDKYLSELHGLSLYTAEALQAAEETFNQRLVELTSRIRDLEADAKRLDWLDSMNLKLNAHYGTTYKWKLILSPNVIRIASGKAGNGYVADIDLQDSFPKGFDSVRKAIDRAREQSKENQG